MNGRISKRLRRWYWYNSLKQKPRTPSRLGFFRRIWHGIVVLIRRVLKMPEAGQVVMKPIDGYRKLKKLYTRKGKQP